MGGEEILRVHMGDVEGSEAVAILDGLRTEGQIEGERHARLREAFAQMHGTLMRTMAHEKELLEEAKALKTRVEEENLELQSVSGRTGDDDNLLSSLREGAEQAETEAALCREREQALMLEVNELQRERDERRDEVEALERDYLAMMEPQIAQHKDDIENITDEVMQDKVKLEASRKEAGALQQNLEDTLGALGRVKEDLVKEKVEVEKARALPETFRKQGEIALKTFNNLKGEENRILTKIREYEADNNKVNQKIKDLNEDHVKYSAQIEKLRLAYDQKEKAMDQIRKDGEITGIDKESLLAEQVRLDLQFRQTMVEQKAENDTKNSTTKERDRVIRRLKTLENALLHVENAIPALESQRDQTKYSVQTEHNTKKKQEVSIGELKREVDIYMNSYLKKEQIGKEKTALFQKSYAEVAELEKEVVAMKKEEQAREAVIKEVTSQRERVSRQAALKVQKWKETEELRQVKDLIILDLKKKKKDTGRRLKEFQQLYDLVKNQRNKFVNMIQTSTQSIAEMKEKLKILGNEIDILRTETLNKEKLLAKARTDHSNAQIDRDHLRSELNKCALTFKIRQEAVEEQITEIDKLHAIINTSEKEMLHLKKQYQTCVESRNYTGIMLIDRNDELCILYEKSNIQEEVLKHGEISLVRKENEIRMLQLELKEIQRSIDATRKVLPQVPSLDESIASLQQQLLEARDQAAELEAALESPNNKQRWRRLEGKIPEKDELVAKVNQLEERLNDKKEQLLEKNLILDEVTTLSDRLRHQAKEGRADTLELARKVNGYQSRLRSLTRKMMATVSELSMYQASAMKLDAEKQELEEEKAQAVVNLREGLAPTDDAAREWNRLEHERMQLLEMAKAAAEYRSDLERPMHRTTAEPRPNAYIPEDLGIPKPYGKYAPFKPSEPGTTMRHIRKPEVREIVI